jgi:hypothetical protein
MPVVRRHPFVTTPTGRPTADPQRWWTLDSLRHQGHTHAEVLAFASYLQDSEDEVQAQRDRGVNTTVGLDLGPQPRGLLRRLLGGR